jgi:hypothetical protein
MGHGIIGLISGGTIDKLILGFNARIHIVNAQYNDFTYPLMNMFGLVLPILVLLFVLLTYKKTLNNDFYHIICYIFSVGVVASLLAWIVIPIVSIFGQAPDNDDVTKFLISTEIHPVLISLTAFTIFSLLILLVYKKGLFQKVMEFRSKNK